MNVSNVATDEGSVFRYKPGMTARPRFTSAPPASPMNQWVRDAVEHSGMSMQEISERMNGKNLGAAYDRSKVQKMTVSRKVSKIEAEAIAEITGYPLTDGDAQQMIDDFRSLAPADKEVVRDLIARLSKQATPE